MPPALAFLGLGSNQGDSAATLERAVEVLDAMPHTRVRGVSGLYRTAPVGHVDQADFLNLVVAVQTELPPRRLLETVQAVERSFGRVRDVRWGPRTLDVDILWYDGILLREPDLDLPHPRMGERRFVLEPLAELAPDLELTDGRTVREALADVGDQRVERVTTADNQPVAEDDAATEDQAAD